MSIRMAVAAAVLLAAMPAAAQVRTPPPTDQDDEQPVPQPQQQPTQPRTNEAGRVAESSVGQVGQRQTRESAATETGIKPMARIASRVQNRVQNRVRNRIDRDYDPRANATDPFAVAEDQTKTSGRPRR